MEIKYEAVFGNQELFDGAGTFTGLDVVTRNVDTDLYSYCRREDLTYDYLRKNPVVAMRRIIEEPKRWTVEDNKAGRLPEVGCKVFDVMNENKVIVKAINTRQVCLESSDGFIYLLPPSEIKPIESPEEKAARLEDEFYQAVRKTCAIGSSEEQAFRLACKVAHRMMLSGKLAAPKGGE